MMADFAFYVLWALAFSASLAISWSWGELKWLKENMSTIEAELQDAKETQTNSEALENDVRDLRVKIEREVQLWSRGSAGEKLRGFFSSSNPLVFCFKTGHKIKKLRKRIAAEIKYGMQWGGAGMSSEDEMYWEEEAEMSLEAEMFVESGVQRSGEGGTRMSLGVAVAKCWDNQAEDDTVANDTEDEILVEDETVANDTEDEVFVEDETVANDTEDEIFAEDGRINDNVTSFFFRAYVKIREWLREIVAKIVKLNDNVNLRNKIIVYIVVCIVGVCVDPFFLYIPFLSHTKICLGMNTELWKVAVPLRTIADFFTALISIMSIPQLSRRMSSIKLILLMCVKYLALAPIPQILLSEMCILKTLGGYTFWNLILFCLYGARLVLIFQACEQLKGLVSDRTLVRFNAPVYLFLYLIISHVIGASWYYLSIKRQLSCRNGACKINTGCIFHCDGTTTSTLNSTLVNEFCPLNSQKFGIYLDALQSGIVEDKGVLKKFLQCFYWGIRHLSSFASNLYTSTNDGETFFAIIISIVGLILLVYILQNIRVGLSESTSANSATEGVDSSNQTGEGSSVQRTEGYELV